MKCAPDSPPFNPEPPKPATGTPLDAPIVRLDVEGLTFMRNDSTVFSDLTFSLEAGSILQVEGANGSGKTTLLRTLCGLAPPSGGTIRWCGRAVDDIYPEFLAQLAYVGHSPAVNVDLTPLENLRVARALNGSREIEPEDVLDRLGFPYDLDDVPCRQLSAGQCRRVALGRLLVCAARLWVLDEPFTALDSRGRKQVEQLLEEHAQQGGMAVLSTHHGMQLRGCAVHTLQLR